MIKTTVDTKHNLKIHKCAKEIKDQDILEIMQKFYKGSPTANILWDVSNASIKEVSSETVREALNIIRRNKANRPPSKTAIVASSGLEYGMTRMFQLISDENDLIIETLINNRTRKSG